MGRKNRDWGQAPSVDDPGRASAIRDHTYRTSNGMWQLPKDSEVDAEIARLADQMAAELEITDKERAVVAGDNFDDALTEQDAGRSRGGEVDPGSIGDELTAAGYFWHRAADGSTVTDGWSPDGRGGEQIEDAYIYETQGQDDDEAEVEA